MAVNRILVLVSSRGSNFVALTKACLDGEIPNTEVAGVVTHNPKAPALEQAKILGVPSLVLEHTDREQYHQELIRTLEKFAPTLVCLAGYLRLLPASIVDRWPNRILNIHPSLLPSFPGLNAQKQAIDRGVRWTGCTVHFVNREMDSGPIVAQTPCEVAPKDDEVSLSEKLLTLEHRTYIEAVKRLVTERYEISQERVRWLGQPK